MQVTHYPTYDLDKIEREARQMRAEAVANAAKAAVNWVKTHLHLQSKGADATV